MADTLPTVWPAEPHTLAKHAILRRYLDAWFPILARQSAAIRQLGRAQTREILFIDGFAGPGEYIGGEPGSPVIALKAALEHQHTFPTPARLLFIEDRTDRFQNLQRVLAPHLERSQTSANVHAVEPIHGDCDTELNRLLDEYEKQDLTFGPALAFLDQFGYGSVSMNLIKRVLRYGQCEVFTYLDYKAMNRWITDPTKAPAFTRAYGGQEWQGCINLPERQRRTRLLELYKAALQDTNRADVKYVTTFVMYDDHEQPLYWLLFCTNNLRGLEEMKKAMWAVDRSGGFRFSDKDNPDQPSLLNDRYDDAWLAEELLEKLANRSMTVEQIREYVLVETPCYLFKTAFKSLEVGKTKSVTVVRQPPGRKPGTYSDRLDQIVLSFPAPSLFS
jgi:three-Cys-motif partner protein